VRKFINNSDIIISSYNANNTQCLLSGVGEGEGEGISGVGEGEGEDMEKL